MGVSGLISNFSPKNFTDHIPWMQRPTKPYKVWVATETDNTSEAIHQFKPLGITAKSLDELKEKTWKSLESDICKDLEWKQLSLLKMEDGTSIMDDEYLWQIPSTEDLVVLLPGQTWHANNLQVINQHSTSNAVVKVHSTQDSARGTVDSNTKYYVPTPTGEKARLTLDFFRETADDAGCLRLTAIAAGNGGVTVSYELRLNGLKAILQYSLQWTAVLLTYFGKFMVQTGEILKKKV